MDPTVSRRPLGFSWIVFIGLIVLATLLAYHWWGHSQPVQPGYYRVTKFDDGDTIVVDMNGRAETVRFIGVDTPETHKPHTPIQCFGPEASAYTKRTIGSQSVRLEADPLDTNRDRYGRLLRYVYLPDGTLLDKKLISDGFGLAYTSFPFQKAAEFKAAEQEAEQAGRGLWSQCQVIKDKIGRHTNPA